MRKGNLSKEERKEGGQEEQEEQVGGSVFSRNYRNTVRSPERGGQEGDNVTMDSDR